ncbi:hypothetical protein GCM10025873_21170 [Demequina sediminis]|nr:hypothetical protein GCM10025873_21170 [Demequina sediminis]
MRAKETIALINAVGATINADASLQGRLKVAFPANYNVTLAEDLVPAADLSEQISLAGKEASGTGNMKFALNGALTVGTDDGANVEIRKLVGDENFFLFGMTEPEAADLSARGYDPGAYYESDPQLKAALDLLASGVFTGGERGGAVASIFASLTERDRFMALADFRSYMDAQSRVDAAYADHEAWSRSAVLNVARTGFFSSDRSIQDYLDRIWGRVPSRRTASEACAVRERLAHVGEDPVDSRLDLRERHPEVLGGAVPGVVDVERRALCRGVELAVQADGRLRIE